MKLEKISVKEFLLRTKVGDLDLEDFSAHVIENSKSIQKKYNPFITLKDKIQAPQKKGKLFGLP
ncbi:MAG: hypothetical protein QXD72_02415, partial [Candidatus Aenigmatarchaeota archaeon]